MDNELENMGVSNNQPLYLYQQPMFDITVSVVLINENGVILLEKEPIIEPCPVGDRPPDIFKHYSFPSGRVKAGQETIQFAAVRHVKEQTGFRLNKEVLIPVDFRSSPERSKEGNVVDIGMVCTITGSTINAKWIAVDFERKCLLEPADKRFYMDHDVLLERAIDVMLMLKE